jgi:hypothetical protein
MVAFRSSSRNREKLNFQPVLSIELFLTHMESKLGMPGNAQKLVKDEIHLWRQNFERSNFSLLTSYPNSKQQPLLGFREF